MATQIKCSNCGGTKVSEIGDGKYRCLYCGATFQIEQYSKPQPVVQPQVIVINQPPHQQSQPSVSPEQIAQKTISSKRSNINWLTSIGVILGVLAAIQFIGYITDEYSYGYEHDEKLTNSIFSLVSCIVFLPAAYYTNHKQKKHNG